MASTSDATVTAFYLAYWSQALATNNGDFSDIINAFSTSAEATALFGNDTVTEHIGVVNSASAGAAAILP